jgi:hypothetical protein
MRQKSVVTQNAECLNFEKKFFETNKTRWNTYKSISLVELNLTVLFFFLQNLENKNIMAGFQDANENYNIYLIINK